MSDAPIYDQLCAEMLFTPGQPDPPTSPVEWFVERTDPQATGMLPAVTPGETP